MDASRHGGCRPGGATNPTRHRAKAGGVTGGEMQRRSSATRTQGKTERAGERPRRTRQRWCRVRVETDAGAYVASLELGSVGLRQLVDDERTYLGLWNAQQEGTPGVEEFLALHKGSICSVIVVGEEQKGPRQQEA